MTKTDWTKEDVRKWADQCHVGGWPTLEIILRDFAERIEADEVAVPKFWITTDDLARASHEKPDWCDNVVACPHIEEVVVIRDGQATTEGVVLVAAIYMGAVKDIFALRSDGPPYNERKVTKDDAAWRAFDHLDAATKALRSVISHFAPDATQATHHHSPDAADSGRVVSEPRFFIDHTMIHDRVTGKHVTCDPDFRDYEINPGETTRINNPDGISNTCALLNNLAASPVGVPDVVSEVMAELEKAIRKFPTWPTDPLHAVGVLNEEVGELNKAVLQQVYEPHKNPAGAVRNEALQSAAMAIRFLSSMSAYQFNPGDQHEQGQSK